jgi:AcrR family transcriptional regulator
MTTTRSAPAWSPNQQAARQRIVEGAADLIARDGLRACTIRAVADETGLKKSTVHSYFDDANELVDLSVTTLLGRLAAQAAADIDEMPDATESLSFLVRVFMGRGGPPPFRDGALWAEYTAHAWKRGAKAGIFRGLETVRAVFEVALAKSGMTPAEAAERSASVHNYLVGAMVRNMVQPIPRDEVARAVSALSGVVVDPERC